MASYPNQIETYEPQQMLQLFSGIENTQKQELAKLFDISELANIEALPDDKKIEAMQKLIDKLDRILETASTFAPQNEIASKFINDKTPEVSKKMIQQVNSLVSISEAYNNAKRSALGIDETASPAAPRVKVGAS